MYRTSDHQALVPLFQRNRAHQQYNARPTRWWDRLAYFVISLKHTGGTNLAVTDYYSRHSTEENLIEKNHEEENVINIVSERFELNQEYGRLLNTDLTFLSTDQNFKDEPKIIHRKS